MKPITPAHENGTVLHRGGHPHVCRPGWEAKWHDGGQLGDIMSLPAGYYMHELDLPPGTVWECTCGTVWVSYRPDTVYRGFVDCDPRAWRKETRRERRRRLRGDS